MGKEKQDFFIDPGELSPAKVSLMRKVVTRARQLDHIDHLIPEAVVAYVDGEMGPKAAHRVKVHLVHCEECLAEVLRQRKAASWVRSREENQELRAPATLLEKLNEIATQSDKDEDRKNWPEHEPEQDFLDKIDMVLRALKRGNSH